MPSSRGRHPRNRSDSERRRGQRRRSEDARAQVTHTPTASGAPSALFYGPGDQDRLRRGIEAEARGDAADALELHLAGPHLEASLREQQLLELVQLGDEVPPWVVSRWIGRQAHRWLLSDESMEMQQAVNTTFDHAYRGVDVDHPLAVSPTGFVARMAAEDWICSQLAVYEYGGLRRFLDTMAQPGLRARAERLEDWLGSRVGGYRFEGVGDDRVLLTDLGEGGLVEVLNLGSTHTRGPGTHVLGRLVPVSVAPGLMFETRPLEVDLHTACAVAETGGRRPATWVSAVGDGINQGRLEPGFSLVEPTSFVCDIPKGAPRGIDLGSRASPGDSAVALAELVLVTVDDDWEAAAHLAPMLTAVLLDPDLRHAIAQRCTGRSRSRAWDWLARALPEPLRRHCVMLGRHDAGAVA